MDRRDVEPAAAGPPRRSRRRLWAVLVVVCLLLGGGLVWWRIGNGSNDGGAGDVATAAQRYGWGTPFDGDEFDSNQLDHSRWRTYDGAGNEGVGLRRPSAVTVENGALAVKGRGDVSGGVAWSAAGPTTYGRWEFRARADAGSGYAQAILLWPDSNKWPDDGEVDIMEITAADRDNMIVTVHYGADDTQESVTVPGTFTDWHTYAVEWAPDHLSVFLDSEQVFTTTTKAAIPTVPMHLAIQNDVGPLPGWIPARNADTPDVVGLYVDWVRMYTV